MQGEPNGPIRDRVERGTYKRATRDGQLRYEVLNTDSDARQPAGAPAGVREARRLRVELLSRVGRGERVAPSRVTLSLYAGEWLAGQAPRLRPATYRHYEQDLRLHILPRLGGRRLADISPDDVAGLIGELEFEGKAGWTIRGVLIVFGRVLASAERRGIIASNPVRRLERSERPKLEHREFPSLNREAIGDLIANAPPKYRALIALSVLTGLRQSEALALRWRDVDVNGGTIRVRWQLGRDRQLVSPKTAAAKREFPIPPSLGRMLANHRLHSPFSSDQDFVFASAVGTPLGHHNIGRRGLEKAIKAAGLPKLTWHDLRHVAASVLIAEGAPVAYIAQVLGHASPAITLSTYAHQFARVEHAQRMRERMEAAFGHLLG
jgi:integrase